MTLQPYRMFLAAYSPREQRLDRIQGIFKWVYRQNMCLLWKAHLQRIIKTTLSLKYVSRSAPPFFVPAIFHILYNKLWKLFWRKQWHIVLHTTKWQSVEALIIELQCINTESFRYHLKKSRIAKHVLPVVVLGEASRHDTTPPSTWTYKINKKNNNI